MISIQKATIADLGNVQQLYVQLFSLMSNLQPDYYQKAEQNNDFLKDAIENESFAILLAKEDETVLGFVIVQEQMTPPYTCLVQHKFAYIMDIVVDSECRGKGIGKKLLEGAEEWSRHKGADYLELGVLNENIGAKRLYEKEGFVFSSHIMRKSLYR